MLTPCCCRLSESRISDVCNGISEYFLVILTIRFMYSSGRCRTRRLLSGVCEAKCVFPFMPFIHLCVYAKHGEKWHEMSVIGRR